MEENQKRRVGSCIFSFFGIALETYLSIKSSPPPPPALSSPVKKEEEGWRGPGGVGGVENRRQVEKSEEGRKRWWFVNLAMGGNPGVMRDRRDLLRC
jgi:hypothetical protein